MFAFILFVTGIILIFSPFIQDQIAILLLNRHLEAIVPEEFEQNIEAEVEFDFSIVESIELTDILSAWDVDLPIIGEIFIPNVDLHLPIIKGVSNEALSVGAGTMRPDQIMGEGNYPLASHRMNNQNLLFTPLERVEVEDDIYLKDASYIYIYTVSHLEIIEPVRVEVIEDQEENILTLITCTEDGSQRLMVRGELTEIVEIDDLEEIEELAIINANRGIDSVVNRVMNRNRMQLIGLAGTILLLMICVLIIKSKRNKSRNEDLKNK